MRTRKRKNPYRFMPLKFFVLSFFVSLVILAAIGGPILFAGADENSGTESDSYLTDWDDRLHLLLGVRNSDSGEYTHFFLIALQPFDEMLYVASLPPQLQLAAGDRQNSLGAFCSYGGITLCAQALSQSFSLIVDRTAVITTEDLGDLVNVCGGVTLRLSKDYFYDNAVTGVSIRLSKGQQQLDGRDFVRLLDFPKPDSLVEQNLLSGQLFVALINQNLKPRINKENNAFTAYIDYFSTDFSYSDYLNRADLLDRVAVKNPCAQLLALGGSFTYENSRFTLTDTAEQELKNTFGYGGV